MGEVTIKQYGSWTRATVVDGEIVITESEKPETPQELILEAMMQDLMKGFGDA